MPHQTLQAGPLRAHGLWQWERARRACAIFALIGFAVLTPPSAQAQANRPERITAAATVRSANGPMRAVVGIDRASGAGSRLLCQAKADFASSDWDLCGAGVPPEARPTSFLQLSHRHSDAGRVLMGTAGGSGLYFSDDLGKTFSSATDFPAGHVYTLAVSEETIFAAADQSRLLQSTDGGVSWSLASYVPKALVNGQESESPAWDLTARFGALFARIFNRGVYMSVDGGVSWSSITPDDLLAEDQDWEAAPYELEFESRANYILAASGSGLWRARVKTSRGEISVEEWQRLPFYKIGTSFDVRSLSFSTIRAETAPGTLLIGTLSEGAWMIAEPINPRHATRVATAEDAVTVIEPLIDGGFAVSGPSSGFDTVLAKTAVVGRFPEDAEAVAGATFRSRDGQQRIFLPIRGGERRTWAMCMDSPEPSDSAWAICGRGLPSPNNGPTAVLVTDVPSGDGWTTKPRIWVGTWGDWGLYVSDDLGESFAPVSRPEPPYWGPVYDIERAVDGTLFLASFARVFSSRDDGRNWSPGGRPLQLRPPAWRLATHPSKPEVLYARVPSKGVFWSRDRGETWAALADDADIQELAKRDPRAHVLNGDAFDLQFSPNSEEFLFTGSGDGLWRIRLGANGEAVGSWEQMGVHALAANRPPFRPEVRRLRFITDPDSRYRGDLLLGTWGHGVIRLDNPIANSTGAFRQLSPSGQVQALVPSSGDRAIVGAGYDGINVLSLGAVSTGLPGTSPARVASSQSWNYPNPFSSGTTVTFELSHPTVARLDVFDALGRIVSSPLKGTLLGSGTQQVRFDGSKLSPGLYFYRLSAEGRTEMRQMVISR